MPSFLVISNVNNGQWMQEEDTPWPRYDRIIFDTAEYMAGIARG